MKAARIFEVIDGEAENMINEEIPDTFLQIRNAGITATTSITMLCTDEELRLGSYQSRQLHEHRRKYHGDEHTVPIFYPAGKPLVTRKEIINWRNKQWGVYRVDNWILNNYKEAVKYSEGKVAKTKQGYVIQIGELPKRNY